MFLYYIRYGLYLGLTWFGFLSKYLKTDEIKGDLTNVTRSKLSKWLNFDEFRVSSSNGFSSCVTKNKIDLPKENNKIVEEYKKQTTTPITPSVNTDKPVNIDKEIEVVQPTTPANPSTSKELKDGTLARTIVIRDIDFNLYTEPEITGNINADKSLLILDDVELMKNLYSSDFRRVLRSFNKDINKDFKLVYVIGQNCGYEAFKYIDVCNNKVDYALLDITLGTVVKTKTGKHVEIDGVDIAMVLLEKNPDVKFKFVSAHTLNRYNHTMQYYFNKFEKSTGLNISNHFIFKNDNRHNEFYKLLYNDNKPIKENNNGEA